MDGFIKLVALDVDGATHNSATFTDMHGVRTTEHLENPKYDTNGRLLCKLHKIHHSRQVSYLTYGNYAQMNWFDNSRVHEVSGASHPKKRRGFVVRSTKLRCWFDGKQVEAYVKGPVVQGARAKYFIRDRDRDTVQVIRGRVYQDASLKPYFVATPQ